MSTETVRDFYGKILGRIETNPNGDKTVRDFYGKIQGRYDSRYNVTRDFYGKIVARGDASAGLIPRDK